MPPGMNPDQSREWWRAFNGNFTNRELSVAEFIESIRQGYAYAPQHRNYREAGNFICGQHVALDFDTQDYRSTFEHLLTDPFIAANASFLHTTPSHTPETPKCRVVFILDRSIRDRAKYILLAESLVYRYSMADTKCKDACRLFFGAVDCQVAQPGNVLSLETAASELVQPYQDHLAQAEQERQERLSSITIISSQSAPAGLLKAKADKLLTHVRHAPDGEKYATLRDIGRTFGGYVAGGYYNQLDVVTWLQDAIASNPNNVKDLRAAYAAVEESVSYGLAQPLYFELETQPERELDRVRPPLTPEQKAQVAAIHRELEETAVWKAYHDRMTKAQRLMWGLPDSILDHFQLGYRPQAVDEETGEIVPEALTVPYVDTAGNVVNIEYRMPDGAYGYENDIAPTLYHVRPFGEAANGPVLVMDDAVTAVTTYLSFGYRYQVAGLPHLRLRPESVAGLEDEMIIVMGPETNAKEYNLALLRDRARFVRLPFPIERMVKCGSRINGYELTDLFDLYVKQARKWA